MTKCEHALALAAKGFWIFPITPGQKKPPAIFGWQERATRDARDIHYWFDNDRDYNIGISTSKFGDDAALLVVDVDNKGGKYGDAELLRLELSGFDLPETFSARTPTGGRHLIYRCVSPVRQGANVLAPGLDTRSSGGYIVAAGSVVEAGTYTADDTPVVDAPDWLLARCGKPAERDGEERERVSEPVDEQRASERGRYYLLHEAPLAVEGQGGDDTTYRVAAHLKDFGLSGMEALSLMRECWNERCTPPWDFDELVLKVHNAYAYGKKPQGANSPEAAFKEPYQEPEPVAIVRTPLDTINQDYALITGEGSHIVQEQKDKHGLIQVKHLSMSDFHVTWAPVTITVGKKEMPVSHEWVRWVGRRVYTELVFMPGQVAPGAAFNLWKGFAYEPADSSDHPAVVAFRDHLFFNVCHGESGLAHWLTSYFATLIQRPWEKPLVALVLRGSRGVGKNALVERVGALLGHHFLLTSNRRYLVGNFNGHLENCLLFALDEAFWSGDKQAEGTLKDLITGREHVIEHKGKEPYTVANKTRVVIIGNEDWLVPAAHDERRFAVFDVGDGKKQDRGFFANMRTGMETGGYRSLLRYLHDYDCAGTDLNAAPSTEALAQQKLHSLEPFHQWWLACLEEGRIGELDFGTAGLEVECERFRSAFRRDAQERQIRSRLLEQRSVRRLLGMCVKSVTKKRMSKKDGRQPYAYQFPPLTVCRQEWEVFIGRAHKWPE